MASCLSSNSTVASFFSEWARIFVHSVFFLLAWVKLHFAISLKSKSLAAATWDGPPHKRITYLIVNKSRYFLDPAGHLLCLYKKVGLRRPLFSERYLRTLRTDLW